MSTRERKKPRDSCTLDAHSVSSSLLLLLFTSAYIYIYIYTRAYTHLFSRTCVALYSARTRRSVIYILHVMYIIYLYTCALAPLFSSSSRLSSRLGDLRHRAFASCGYLPSRPNARGGFLALFRLGERLFLRRPLLIVRRSERRVFFSGTIACCVLMFARSMRLLSRFRGAFAPSFR